MFPRTRTVSDVGLTGPRLPPPNDNSALTPAISIASVECIGDPDAATAVVPDAPTTVVRIAWGAATTSGGVGAAGAFEASNDGIVGGPEAATPLVELGTGSRSGGMVDVAGKPDAPSIDAPDAPTIVVEIAWGAATTSGGVETAGAFEASNDGIVGGPEAAKPLVDVAGNPDALSIAPVGDADAMSVLSALETLKVTVFVGSNGRVGDATVDAVATEANAKAVFRFLTADFVCDWEVVRPLFELLAAASSCMSTSPASGFATIFPAVDSFAFLIDFIH